MVWSLIKVATLLDARGVAQRECVGLPNLSIWRATVRSFPSVTKENETVAFYSDGTSLLKFVFFFFEKWILQCFFLAKTSIFVNVFQSGGHFGEDHCTAVPFHACAISVTFALFSHLPCVHICLVHHDLGLLFCGPVSCGARRRRGPVVHDDDQARRRRRPSMNNDERTDGR